tara:strand:- start:647 stop:1240 length:594 start_codon:yes stop_codon:yes gene_type:complete
MFNFNAPIPGESLTKELGGYAWENPPKFDLLEDALDDYLLEMQKKEVKDDIFLLLDIGVPLDIVVETLTLNGVMKGRHNIDVQILLMPLLTEYIKALADVLNLEYIESTEQLEETPQAMKEKENTRLIAQLNAELKGLSAKKIKQDTGLSLIENIKETLEEEGDIIPPEDNDIELSSESISEGDLDTPRKGLMRKEK